MNEKENPLVDGQGKETTQGSRRAIDNNISHFDYIINKFRNNRPKPGGGVMATCPAHDDKKQSLSIDEGDDGRVLLKCFANCETADVIRAAGLDMADLMPPKRQEARPKIVATYDYIDLSDALRYQVVRFDPKDFRQRRPDGHGGWVWSLKGVERVPYCLPELVEAVKAGRTIYICEGEKDVLRIEALGLTATCNAGGAGKWDASFGKWLRSVDVVVLADNDEPGRKHAQDVAGKLAGVARSIKILNLPGLPVKGDISDWIQAGGTREQLEKLVADTPEWTEAEAPGGEVPEVDRHYAKARTDLGNAERFAERYRGRILFDARIGCPRVFDGRRWVPDANGEALRMAQKVARSIYREAESAKDPDEAQALARHAAATEQKNRLQSMLDLTWSLEGMTARPDQWDSDPYVLNCLNCVVDLRTGQLRPRKREDFLTRLAPVEYSPNARHEILDRVLRDALPDAEARAYFQRLVGCSIIGEQVEDIVAFIYGPTGTGKTSISEPLRKHLGDYAATLEPGALMAKSFNNPGAASPELARLAGVRFVVSSELQDGAKLDAGLVKRASGGEAIIARQLYAQPFEFIPAFTLWMVSNHYPIVDASDGAIWRRLKVLPFLHSIPQEQRNPAIKKAMLTECGPALIAWAVQGAIDYLKNGLGVEPEAIRKATAEYRESQDPLADFLSDCLVIDDGQSISAKDLREAYEHWTQENGVKHPLSARTIGMKLKARGLTNQRTMNGIVWHGIGLAHEGYEPYEGSTRNFSHTRGVEKKSMENGSYGSYGSCKTENDPEKLTPDTLVYDPGDDEDWSEARVY